MAKGKKYNDDIKEKAFALLAVNNSVSYVAEQLGLPRTTVRTWKVQYDKKAAEGGEDTIDELRQKNKAKFVDEAWGLIGKIRFLLERRLDCALDSEDILDELVEEITKLDHKQLTDSQRKALYCKMSAIKIESVKELAVVLGTLYDKQAHANKEGTAIVEGNIAVKKFEDF